MAGEEGAHSETKSAASSSSSASKLGVAAPERSLVCGSLLHDEPGALDDGAGVGGNQGTISEGAGAGRALLGSGGVAVPCRGVPPRSFAAQSRLDGQRDELAALEPHCCEPHTAGAADHRHGVAGDDNVAAREGGEPLAPLLAMHIAAEVPRRARSLQRGDVRLLHSCARSRGSSLPTVDRPDKFDA